MISIKFEFGQDLIVDSTTRIALVVMMRARCPAAVGLAFLAGSCRGEAFESEDLQDLLEGEDANRYVEADINADGATGLAAEAVPSAPDEAGVQEAQGGANDGLPESCYLTELNGGRPFSRLTKQQVVAIDVHLVRNRLFDSSIESIFPDPEGFKRDVWDSSFVPIMRKLIGDKYRDVIDEGSQQQEATPDVDFGEGSHPLCARDTELGRDQIPGLCKKGERSLTGYLMNYRKVEETEDVRGQWGGCFSREPS